MRQVKHFEMTLINKISHCMFEKATIRSLLVKTADLKYVSEKSCTYLILNEQ